MKTNIEKLENVSGRLADAKRKVKTLLCPEFDENQFAAELIASGKPFSEIAAAVKEAKKEHKENAKVLTLEQVKEQIKNSSLFAEFISAADLTAAQFERAGEKLYKESDGKIVEIAPETTKEMVDAIASYSIFLKHNIGKIRKENESKKEFTKTLEKLASLYMELGINYSDFQAQFSAALTNEKIKRGEMEKQKKADLAKLVNNYWFAAAGAEKICCQMCAAYAAGKKAKARKLKSELIKFQSSRNTCKVLINQANK